MGTTILKQFLKKPKTTGAVWSSSPSLCDVITSEVGIENAEMIVELGPGTGAVTEFILQKKNSKAKFIAIEVNQEMHDVFARKYPNVKVYNDCASKLPEIISQKENVSKGADLIISGLPWATFSSSLQEEILDSIVETLADNGIFTTYGYIQGILLPAAGAFKKLLDKHFSTVKKTPVVWKNIPPAFCYRCRK